MNTQEELTVHMLADMIRVAKEHNVAPTENTEKVARARVVMGLPITVCPCASKDTERGCIGTKCLQEINDKEYCHCRAYKRIGGTNGEFNKGSSAL